MNLLLFEPNEIKNDDSVSLKDRRSEHIVRILGCKPGDIIRAGMINGPVGTAKILSIQGKGKCAEVVLHFSAHGELPKQPEIDVVMGMMRPIMLKRVLAQLASLGVGKIFLINAHLVEKSFFNASLLKNEKYRTYLIEGLEQAKDTRLPQVSIHKRFKPFIEDFIPLIADNYNRMLVAHPEGGSDLKQAVGNAIKGRTLLAVGPEGGWIDFEIEKFTECSFVPVSMGSRVLRTDTAVVSLLAQLMLLRGES
ncbi:MAG: 16S rRNA (uracil(1498)-N(3))-methyltransferase [Deltaproteobacteria bacterium]|nr:MAG: 16S rRNA (uracil(1498)-N(3))-methyltransferase [Deltaproteobacteria bacterium]